MVDLLLPPDPVLVRRCSTEDETIFPCAAGQFTLPFDLTISHMPKKAMAAPTTMKRSGIIRKKKNSFPDDSCFSDDKLIILLYQVVSLAIITTITESHIPCHEHKIIKSQDYFRYAHHITEAMILKS